MSHKIIIESGWACGSDGDSWEWKTFKCVECNKTVEPYCKIYQNFNINHVNVDNLICPNQSPFLEFKK